MESIIRDIEGMLDAVSARGQDPVAIVLGTHQTELLEAELRPHMLKMLCEHVCDLDCLRRNAMCVHEPQHICHGRDWPGIDRTGAVTLYGVPLSFVDDEHALAVKAD